MNFLMVALCGGLGAIGRYAISLIPMKSQFPFRTLVVNLFGAIFIGFIVGFAESRKMSSNTNLFLKVGFCGGFTTFSTFSLEAFNLINEKSYFLCGIYITLSIVGCLAGILVGKKLATSICG